MEELTKLSRKELIIKCRAYIGNCSQQQNSLISKQAQIKHFRNKLKKIQNSIDYLLKHPFSRDVGNRTIKHKRDIPYNQKSKLK